MKNEMIMNVTPGETRIARFLDGVLSELAIESFFPADQETAQALSRLDAMTGGNA